MHPALSKSKLISSLQCTKRLWLELHKADTADLSASNSATLDAGLRVGEIATRLYGPGAEIDKHVGMEKALADTARLISQDQQQPLFEATFCAGGVLIRGDILLPVGNGGYHLIEVKSSTSVKDVHVSDAAIQYWVLTEAGVNVTAVSIAHINKEFVYRGSGQYAGLFNEVDLTSMITELRKQVPSWIHTARITSSGDEPFIDMGEQCSKPYPCPFTSYCSPSDTPPYPITILPGRGKVVQNLAAAGYRDLREVPSHLLTKDVHLRIWEASRSGACIHDPAVAEVINSLPFPRYFFDFETISSAVPLWPGTKPYQQVPFQWSCHVDSGDGDLRHSEFLATSGEDPREECASQLVDALSSDGPIVAYNARFEKMIIRGLAKEFPRLSSALLAMEQRFFDPMPLIQEYYYHPRMLGSWSLKRVLPALVPELDYANLDEVRDGSGAQTAYLEITNPETNNDRKHELCSALRRYCELDTYAMYAILERLRNPSFKLESNQQTKRA